MCMKILYSPCLKYSNSNLLQHDYRKIICLHTCKYEQLASSDSSLQSSLELHLLAKGMQSPEICNLINYA